MAVKIYSLEEVADLLQKAKDLGLNLEAGSDLEELTIAELASLVNYLV